jgi:hypothetical protein
MHMQSFSLYNLSSLDQGYTQLASGPRHEGGGVVMIPPKVIALSAYFTVRTVCVQCGH